MHYILAPIVPKLREKSSKRLERIAGNGFKLKFYNSYDLMSAQIALNNGSCIAIVLHRYDDVFQDFNIVDLVIQIEETIAFVNSIFY